MNFPQHLGVNPISSLSIFQFIPKVANPWLNEQSKCYGSGFDQGDLPYWAQKFASSARIEEDFIVAELGDEVGWSMVQ